MDKISVDDVQLIYPCAVIYDATHVIIADDDAPDGMVAYCSTDPHPRFI